jgi:hypothetical protein
MDDNLDTGRQRSAPSSTIHGRPLSVQHPRSPYPAYSPDYSAYYQNAPTREQYMEYAYGYDAYRGSPERPLFANSGGMTGASSGNVYAGMSSQTLLPTAQHYEYGGSARPPGSPFYYPAYQNLMYSPAHSPMLAAQLATPTSLSDKKREMQVCSHCGALTTVSQPIYQYNIQQQLTPQQSLMYSSLRTPQSPLPQGYPANIDYAGPHPLIISGFGMYGTNPQAMQLYPQGMQSGRPADSSEPSTPLRSALLEDFRANRTRNWELRVNALAPLPFSLLTSFSDRTYSGVSWNSAVTNTARASSNKNWRLRLARKNRPYSTR